MAVHKEEDTEKLLVTKLQRGNERAFRKLFNLYQRDIYAYSLSLLKSKHRAEENVQEVFLKVWLNRKKINPKLSFKLFIFTIARNLAFNSLAKTANNQKLREVIFYKSQQKHNPADRQLMEADYEKLKQQAIEELSPRCKLVFQMSRKEGKSYQEISHELGVSVNTVKNQMSTALGILKKFLTTHGDIVFLLAFLAENFQ